VLHPACSAHAIAASTRPRRAAAREAGLWTRTACVGEVRDCSLVNGIISYSWRLLERRHAFARCPDEGGHVALGVPALVHELVRRADLVEREYAGEAWVDLAIDDEIVEAVRLLIVGEVRALQPLLAHPEVAQVDDGVVARGAGADDDHAAG